MLLNRRKCIINDSIYFLNPQNEGPMKHSLYIWPFVCLPWFLILNSSWKLPSYLKKWGSQILWKKSWSEVLGSKGPEMSFFNIYEKLTYRIFPTFCMKLQQHKVLKLTHMIFLGKNFVLKFWVQKLPKMGLKWGFSSFMNY